MASTKRQRQRANKELSTALSAPESTPPLDKATWMRKKDALLDAAIDPLQRKDALQRVAGISLAVAFYYGVYSKLGAVQAAMAPKGLRADSPLPTFRGVLPEPFDAPSHLSNAYWTKLLMDVKWPILGRSMQEHKFALRQIDHHLADRPAPSLARTAATAGAIGTALHVGIETVTEFIPGTLGRLMGGFDPLDVAYGGAAAAIIAGYSAYRQRNSIDEAALSFDGAE